MSIFDEAVIVARRYLGDGEISKAWIRNRSKKRYVVQPRNFVMAYLRAVDPKRFSYPVIARIVGLKDHTSVMNGVANACRDWGGQLFLRLTRHHRIGSGYQHIDTFPADFVAASLPQILARGELLMRIEMDPIFTNSHGWTAIIDGEPAFEVAA